MNSSGQEPQPQGLRPDVSVFNAVKVAKDFWSYVSPINDTSITGRDGYKMKTDPKRLGIHSSDEVVEVAQLIGDELNKAAASSNSELHPRMLNLVVPAFNRWLESVDAPEAQIAAVAERLGTAYEYDYSESWIPGQKETLQKDPAVAVSAIGIPTHLSLKRHPEAVAENTITLKNSLAISRAKPEFLDSALNGLRSQLIHTVVETVNSSFAPIPYSEAEKRDFYEQMQTLDGELKKIEAERSAYYENDDKSLEEVKTAQASRAAMLNTVEKMIPGTGFPVYKNDEELQQSRIEHGRFAANDTSLLLYPAVGWEASAEARVAVRAAVEVYENKFKDMDSIVHTFLFRRAKQNPDLTRLQENFPAFKSITANTATVSRDIVQLREYFPELSKQHADVDEFLQTCVSSSVVQRHLTGHAIESTAELLLLNPILFASDYYSPVFVDGKVEGGVFVDYGPFEHDSLYAFYSKQITQNVKPGSKERIPQGPNIVTPWHIEVPYVSGEQVKYVSLVLMNPDHAARIDPQIALNASDQIQRGRQRASSSPMEISDVLYYSVDEKRELKPVQPILGKPRKIHLLPQKQKFLQRMYLSET